ncbi:unnamed protein product [Cunninghamella echinulata]
MLLPRLVNITRPLLQKNIQATTFTSWRTISTLQNEQEIDHVELSFTFLEAMNEKYTSQYLLEPIVLYMI